MDRRAFVLSATGLVLGLVAGTPAASLDSSPGSDYPAPAPGLQSAVGRVFVPAGRRTPSLTYIEARISVFDNPGHASDAIDLWFDQTRGDTSTYTYSLAELSPVGVMKIKDETRAITGTAARFDDDSVTEEVAAVVVREGSTLLALLAWSDYSDVVDEAVRVAERTFGLKPLDVSPVPGVAYNVGDEWDLLPRIEHLPKGLTWLQDFSPCIGVFGASDCPVEATPAATPHD